jgi:uncharacterized membrane protein YesL
VAGALLAAVQGVANLLHLPAGWATAFGAALGIFGLAPASKAKLEEVRQARKNERKGDQK